MAFITEVTFTKRATFELQVSNMTLMTLMIETFTSPMTLFKQTVGSMASMNKETKYLLKTLQHTYKTTRKWISSK